MRATAVLLFASGLLCLALQGCGASEAKRSVDARTEAIRFFAVDTPFLAVADPGGSDSDQLAEAQRGLTRIDALGSFTRRALGFASGLRLAPLRPLLTDDDPDDGIAASQIALGLEPGPAADQTVMIAVTDKPDQTAAAVQRIAAQGGLAPAGQKDDAQLYAGGGAAIAVRDGVVVLARSPRTLRAAIALRDGDDDAQLDEGPVNDLIRKLPEPGEVQAYADVGGLLASDPGMAALASGSRAWTRSLGHAALSLAPAGGGLRLDLVAEVEPGATGNGETPPVGQRPERFAITPGEVRLARASRSTAGAAFGLALEQLAPLRGEASINSGQLLVVARSGGG
jgi:hypothetical protein